MIDLADLARRTGRSVTDVTEIYEERAAIREFLGGYRRLEAERLGLQDTIAWCERQGRLP